MRECLVELRKMFLRQEFYLALLVITGVVGFLMQQLTVGGSYVTISGDSVISYNELMESIFNMLHDVGLIGIILAILCWQTFGRESDHGSMTTYFLNSQDKWKFIIAKIVITTFALLIILLTSLITMLLIYAAARPAQYQLLTSSEDILHLVQTLILTLLSGITFITLTALVSLRLGSMGVLGTTIGLSILSAIISNTLVLQPYLPTYLATRSNFDSILVPIGYFSCYLIFLHIVLRFVSKKKEIGV